MTFFSTQLDKGGTKRIELYYKIAQIILIVVGIFWAIAAFILMARLFELEEFGLGFFAFFVMLLTDLVLCFFGNLLLNISCGLYYDVRRIRMAEERTALSNGVQEQPAAKETVQETVRETVQEPSAQRFVCPKCKKIVIYGCESCENCGQRFSWNIQA